MSAVVGVLGVQGAVGKHLAMLEAVGAAGRVVLGKDDLASVDALILPGGESTTISKGLERLGLVGPIQAFAREGRPVLGTCAGAILLARRCVNHPVPTLGLLDATARRNAYGTQVDSFTAIADPADSPEFADLRCIFIRAPQLAELGPDVETLVTVDGLPVLVREGNILASTFHPELGDDSRVHSVLVGLAGRARD